jgi:hypothetical protein
MHGAVIPHAFENAHPYASDHRVRYMDLRRWQGVARAALGPLFLLLGMI